MPELHDDMPKWFHETVEKIAEYISIDEEFVMIGGLVAVGAFLVFVTFLITRALYRRKKGFNMSTPEERAQRSRDRLTYHPDRSQTPEQVRTSPPNVDDLLKSASPFHEKELGSMDDIHETSTSPIHETGLSSDQPVASSGVSVPVDLAEPGIILLYKTRKQESTSVRKGVVEKLIKDRIDEIPMPFGTAGLRYTYVLDLSSKDLTAIFGDIELLQCNITSTLKELGLTCRILDKNSSVEISGVLTKEFSGRLFFFLIHPDYQKELPSVPSGSKGGFSSFSDYPAEYVHSKAFQINADPRSLWQDLPVADYEGYHNKDDDNDAVEITISPEKKGGIFSGSVPAQLIEILAASRRGRSHAHAAKPRDDCFYYEIDKETGWNFVAVADGAGSAKYSRKGSEIACQTVVSQLHGLMNAEYDNYLRKEASLQLGKAKVEFVKSNGKWDEGTLQSFAKVTKLDQIFHKAIDSTIRAIHEEAKRKEGAVVKDYHTTLLCAAFKYFEPTKDPREISGWFFASYWVGDGGAAILRWNNNDGVLVLGEPDGGEFAGQTRFLTIPDEIQAETIKKRVRFSFCDSFEALLLVTDGITDPFFPSEAAVVDERRWLEFYEQKLLKGCEEEPTGCPSLFDKKRTPLQKSEYLLHWLNFWSKGNHDDRTIMIVRPR